MEVNTGNIFLNPSEAETKLRGLVEIPADQAETVINMNRRQRRAWGRYQLRHPGATMEQFREATAHYLFAASPASGDKGGSHE